MEKEQRNALRNAVVRCRRLLEKDIQEQLEATYNILRDGRILDSAPGDPIVRGRLLEVIRHHRALGATAEEAVDRTVREAAFTVLNRFAALKMAERRDLVRECVSEGLKSEGVRELMDCAPGLRGALEDGGYRLLLEALMDEISVDLKVLFDRRAAMAQLWPGPTALQSLLDALNDTQLRDVWSEDEAIGWIYQYFNADDVKDMREEAPAPRNSRELAVRNQFFTPRYVVQFLVDNTLGRLWYEMRKGRTALRERSPMLVFEPNEPPPTRAMRDPRDLRVLDPAVGSGHFLLYAFDVLETIYREAWESPDAPPSALTGRTLRTDYPAEAELGRAIPGLILGQNLHGIEIDSRAAQIAALALWLRAQRAYQERGIPAGERPRIARSNIVVAEPMPGEPEMLEQFVARLDPPPLRDLVRRIWEEMRLAGEAGSLLEIEERISTAVEQAARATGPLVMQSEAGFWPEAENRLRDALEQLAREAGEMSPDRRRLFAEDAARGIAFIDVCRERFDVVVMNPPFGAASVRAKPYVDQAYPRTKNDLYAAFVERTLSWLRPRGRLGAITSRTGFFLTTFQAWREEILLGEAHPVLMADLGYGVMDEAMVEAAAYVLERPA